MKIAMSVLIEGIVVLLVMFCAINIILSLITGV